MKRSSNSNGYSSSSSGRRRRQQPPFTAVGGGGSPSTSITSKPKQTLTMKTMERSKNSDSNSNGYNSNSVEPRQPLGERMNKPSPAGNQKSKPGTTSTLTLSSSSPLSALQPTRPKTTTPTRPVKPSVFPPTRNVGPVSADFAAAIAEAKARGIDCPLTRFPQRQKGVLRPMQVKVIQKAFFCLDRPFTGADARILNQHDSKVRIRQFQRQQQYKLEVKNLKCGKRKRSNIEWGFFDVLIPESKRRRCMEQQQEPAVEQQQESGSLPAATATSTVATSTVATSTVASSTVASSTVATATAATATAATATVAAGVAAPPTPVIKSIKSPSTKLNLNPSTKLNLNPKELSVPTMAKPSLSLLTSTLETILEGDDEDEHSSPTAAVPSSTLDTILDSNTFSSEPSPASASEPTSTLDTILDGDKEEDSSSPRTTTATMTTAAATVSSQASVNDAKAAEEEKEEEEVSFPPSDDTHPFHADVVDVHDVNDGDADDIDVPFTGKGKQLLSSSSLSTTLSALSLSSSSTTSSKKTAEEPTVTTTTITTKDATTSSPTLSKTSVEEESTAEATEFTESTVEFPVGDDYNDDDIENYAESYAREEEDLSAALDEDEDEDEDLSAAVIEPQKQQKSAAARKMHKKNKKKTKKTSKALEAEKSNKTGAHLLPKKIFRDNNQVLPVSTDGTCLPDTVAFVLTSFQQQGSSDELLSTSIRLPKGMTFTPTELTKHLRSNLCLNGEWASPATMVEFLPLLGFHATAMDFEIRRSKAALLNQPDGAFLILCHLKDQEGKTSKHAVAYIAVNKENRFFVDSTPHDAPMQLSEDDITVLSKQDSKSKPSRKARERAKLLFEQRLGLGCIITITMSYKITPAPECTSDFRLCLPPAFMVKDEDKDEEEVIEPPPTQMLTRARKKKNLHQEESV